jgi:hypothetical protein
MQTNPEFLALVISMCAAIVVTLPRKAAAEYSGITVSKSLHLVRYYNLLQPTTGCSVGWCVAYYLLAWAQMGEHGFTGFDVFNNLKSAMSGVQWLLSFQPRQSSFHDEEILKRLYWQLTILDMLVIHLLLVNFSFPWLIITLQRARYERVAGLFFLPSKR